MQNRIKELRAALGLTQGEFGAKIRVSGAAVSRWESGERAAPDVAIYTICREFGASEQWLRTGAGSMFAPRHRETELYDLVSDLLQERPGSFRAALITALLRFDPGGAEWAAIEAIYNSVAAELDATPDEPPGG